MKNTKTPQERGDWGKLVPENEWAVYKDAIGAVRPLKIPFVLGGAFGLATYTGKWRNTKDMDFFVKPSDKDRVVEALLKIGFEDYYPRLAYDRGWIYRAVRDDVLVDVIWGTPNRVTEVDDEWFQHQTPVQLKDELLAALPAEELLYIKLFVMQRDRCDWPDLLNLLYAEAENLDWDRVIRRLGPDLQLLQGLMQVFAWLAPTKVMALSKEARDTFSIPKPSKSELDLAQETRVRLLDSRGWFCDFQPDDRPMKL
ncbi:MAG TPA: nucleotidyltransferase family protein [Methylomirabilota bacterium]|nr:nucleotidyltransferase family protein [Methylomirabilota bacterium]